MQAGGAGRPPCPSDDVDAKGAEIACARRSRLAMDWADGAMFKDFLGFAILRSPGFHLGEKDGYSSTRSASRLRDPVRSRCQATSRLYRSFCGGIPRLRRPTGERNSPTRSRPCAALVRWTSSFMMKPRPKPVEVPVPTVERDKISTWFNRAVVSSQSFSKKFSDPVSGHHFQINNLNGTGEDSLETCHACQLDNLLWTPKAL